MAESQQEKAKKVYETMVSALNHENWIFEEKGDLCIMSDYQGEDIPIRFFVEVDADREVIRFLSSMPFNINKDKRVDAALAVCVANYGMVNGSFDYDLNDGEIRFRLTTSYCGCEIGEPFFMDMITTAILTTDKYNELFMMLNRGLIDLEEFIEKDKA